MNNRGFRMDCPIYQKMHTGPPNQFLLEVCDYGALKEADRQIGNRHNEEWLINLQNHLLWGSYIPDIESVQVVKLSILRAMVSLGVSVSELPRWAVNILEDF